MNFKLFFLLATAFANTSKYMKIPVYWDDKHHENNIILMNNLAKELSKSLLFYDFEQLSSDEVDKIPIDQNGGKAEKQLRGFLHEFYRNAAETNVEFKKQQSRSFVQLLQQRNKTIWFGASGFDRSKTIGRDWKAMAIPFFYNSTNKDLSSKAQNALGTLEKELENKVTLWKFVPKAEMETPCPKSSLMQKQGTILEVYATESEMTAKVAPGTGFKEFASARFEQDPAYQFGMIGFEEVGAKQSEAEVIPPVTEQTPLVEPKIEAPNAPGFKFLPCKRRKKE